MKHPKLILNSLFYCAIILLIGCKKDGSKNQPDNLKFFHVYTLAKDQIVSYVQQLESKEYLIIGTTNEYLTFIKADKYGNYMSDKVFGDTFSSPQVTLLAGGELLISSKKFYGNILKIGKNGEILFNKVFEKKEFKVIKVVSTNFLSNGLNKKVPSL